MRSLILFLCSALAATPSHEDILLSDRDLTVSPTSDFFQYANGGWFARHPIPANETSSGIVTLLHNELNGVLRDINEGAARAPRDAEERLIGDFWATAMDEGKARDLGLRPLAGLLARIAAVKNQAAVLDVAFELMRLNVPVLVRVSVNPDRLEGQRYTLYLAQVRLGLPDRDYYLRDDADLTRVRSKYLEYIQSTLRWTGGNPSRAAEVLKLETRLARASLPLEQTRDPRRNYNRVSPAELTLDFTPSINWTKRLQAWGLSPDFISVGQPKYFAALESVLAGTPVDVLKDYLRFHLLAAYAPYLSPTLEMEHFQMYGKTLNGQQALQPRWKRVLSVEEDSTMQNLYPGFGVISPIGMLVGRRYIAEHFPETVRQRYTGILLNIRDTYAERIRQSDWLSDVTRQQALRKLSKLGYKVGGPDRWPDYSQLSVGRASYCDNMMQIARWAFAERLAKVGQPVDRGEWLITPQTFNAYYLAAPNEIVVPAANFVVPGLPESQVDDAVAYGYIGALMGHEMTHGFDDSGRRYDADGNLRDWWSEADSRHFEERARVLVSQFDAYEPLPGLHINGTASLGENIADLGGLAIALQAFQKTEQFKRSQKLAGLTPLQRFFLAYAFSWMSQQRDEVTRNDLLSNVHTPEKWRVNGPLSNLSEFHAEFNTSPDAPMWRAPELRARLW